MSQPDSRSTTVSSPVKATLQALPNGEKIPVHFNPASLVYTVENSTQQQSGDPKRRQFAAQFTAKLTMDLQFDTTDTGADVRQSTTKVALFMQSSADFNKKKSGNGASKPAPPVLSFDWGSYHFQGFMESFKETIDYFSADGIPLRALVSIGLARQDNVFDAGDGKAASTAGTLVPTGQNSNPANLASQAGDPNATRALAAANGLDNPRFTGGAALEVSAGIQLNAAVGFVASASAGVSAGAGISAGAGLGISAGARAGFSAGAGAGFSAGAGAGFSAGAGLGISAGAGASSSISASSASFSTGGALFGSSASAGVPITAGAFAGLEVGRASVSTTAQLDPLRILPDTVGARMSAGSNASFGLGGVALSRSGFSADVGATSSLTARLTFDTD
jgi:hypothetical protein